MLSEIEQNYLLYDTVTSEENSFPASLLNENPNKTMSQLLTTLKRKAQPWKAEVGQFFRKAISLMKQRVISKNSELFAMQRFIDTSYSLTNSAQE